MEVLALLARRRERGVWADHVLEIGERLGICPAADRKVQRVNSWTGPFLRSLAAQGLIRQLVRADRSKVQVTSRRGRANGNPQAVYVLPEHYAAALDLYTRPREEA